jgi:hypothetical protein
MPKVMLSNDTLMNKGAAMKNTIAAGALALALAAAGCGRSEGRSTNDRAADAARQEQAGPLPDPCSLVTKEELAAQLEPLMKREKHRDLRAEVSTQQSTAGAWPTCIVSWKGVDAKGRSMYHDDEQIIHVLTPQQWKEQLADMKEMKGKALTMEPIPGVGDEAFYLEGRPSARVGKTYVLITFPDRASALALLRAAVGRVH